jgi:hypothetical protein
MDWSKIYEGWRNKILPPAHLKQKINETAILRTDVCRGCEHNSRNKKEGTFRPDEHCTLCGCTISAKVRCLSCDCADNPPRWKAVLTRKQEEFIK